MNRAILVIDDETEILNAISRQLRKEPIDVLFAESADKAREILRKRKIQLIITDHRMPGTSGVELLREIKKEKPDIVRLLISGFIEADLLIKAINEGEVYRFIPKPWDKTQLKEYILDSLRHYDVLEENRRIMNRIITANENKTVKRNDGWGGREDAICLSETILDELPFAVIAVIIKMK